MRCDECGFVYEDMGAEEIAPRIRQFGTDYRARLEPLLADRAALVRRPAADVWSVHEYACHVRDVLTIQRDRVLLVLMEDTPEHRPMYRDQRVSLAGYAEEDLERAITGIDLASGLLAHLLERLTPDQLARRCVYQFPERTERDVLWMGRHTVHEGVHHLLDIDRRLAGTIGP